ncbi:MAG: alpha/beta hydrolase [Sediminibacterium sp.]|nr:alpha/beta hydrolase [Sediminibacterium sp.]
MKFIKLFLLFLICWFTFCRCSLGFRWSNKKTLSYFKQEHIPVIIHDTFINLQKLRFIETGDQQKPLLVFIHGSPGSSSAFAAYLVDSSLLTKFNMISFDRPGFGYSNFGKSLHLSAQANILNLVVKNQAKGRKVFICGHSLGGPLVIEMAALDTNLYSKIMVLAGSIDVALEKKENWRYVMNVSPLNWLLPGAFRPSNRELVYLKKDLIELQNQFKKIKIPVMFIHGTKDQFVPYENVLYGKKMLINSPEIMIDSISGANHFIPWTYQQYIISQINKFIY